LISASKPFESSGSSISREISFTAHCQPSTVLQGRDEKESKREKEKERERERERKRKREKEKERERGREEGKTRTEEM